MKTVISPLLCATLTFLANPPDDNVIVAGEAAPPVNGGIVYKDIKLGYNNYEDRTF